MDSTKKVVTIALALTGVALCAFCGRKGADLQGAVITSVKGKVSVTETKSTQEAQGSKERVVGQSDLYTKAGLLIPGMTLWTDNDSQADLQFTSGLVMRVSACSKVKLESARIVVDSNFRQVVINLQAGAVFAKSDKLGTNSSIRVHSPTAIAAVRGTQFYVKEGSHCSGAGGPAETFVEDGQVELSDSLGRNTQALDAGKKGTVSGRGVVLTTMSEGEKVEVANAGRGIQPVTDEGKSRLKNILEDFEENTVRFKETIQDMKSQAAPKKEESAPKAEPTQKSAGSPKEPTAQKAPDVKVDPKGDPKTEAPKQPEKKPAKDNDADSAPML